MFFFGHTGITLGAAQVYNERNVQKLDLRLVMLLSLTPDLIDKPIGLLYPNFFGNNTRLFTHTLLCALAALFFLVKNRKHFALWCAFFGHLVLDRMWIKMQPRIFFWPFLGRMPTFYEQMGYECDSMVHHWYTNVLKPYNLAGEIIGLSIFAFLFFRKKLFKKARMMKFLKMGLL